MKPDWINSPAWAKFAAMDANGDWYWYEKKPFADDDDGGWRAIGRMLPAGLVGETWKDTLEARP